MKKYTLYSIIGFPLIIILLTALIIISFHNNSFNTVEKMYSSYFTNTHLEYNKKIVTNLVKNIKEIIDYENENIEHYVARLQEALLTKKVSSDSSLGELFIPLTVTRLYLMQRNDS